MSKFYKMFSTADNVCITRVFFYKKLKISRHTALIRIYQKLYVVFGRYNIFNAVFYIYFYPAKPFVKRRIFIIAFGINLVIGICLDIQAEPQCVLVYFFAHRLLQRCFIYCAFVANICYFSSLIQSHKLFTVENIYIRLCRAVHSARYHCKNAPFCTKLFHCSQVLFAYITVFIK